MAASGYTPISLYYSTTAAAVPVNTNLVAGELALNTRDEKLYFKNSAGTVKLLASTETSGVTTFAGGTTGLTPASATSGAVTLAGTLAIANGGTNSTATATAGGAGYGTGTAHAYTAAGTTGQVLTSQGASAPTWATPALGSVTSVAATVPSIFSISGSPITTSGTLAMTYSGTALPIANGGTNSTATPTAGGTVYGTGTAQAYTAVGTTGQVLTSQGASAPIWATTSVGAQDYIVQSYGIV